MGPPKGSRRFDGQAESRRLCRNFRRSLDTLPNPGVVWRAVNLLDDMFKTVLRESVI